MELERKHKNSSVEDCMQSFFNIEQMNGDNQYQCDVCQKKTNPQKKFKK